MTRPAVIHLINILQNNDIQLIQTTINSLGKIGPTASESVPTLVQKLKHERSDVRSISAQALGRMGFKSKSAIPDLIKLLYDDNEEVKYRTADALADIAKDVSDNKDVRMIVQLENIARNLKANSDIATEKYEKNEHYKTVIRAINHLKTLRFQNALNFIKVFALEHPILSIIISAGILWIIVCHIILLIRPLYLIRINQALGHYEWQIPNWLGGGGSKIKLRYILYFGFLNYSDRVLDEWVNAHLQMTSDRFNDKGSVKLREIYISSPVLLNDKPVSNLTQSSLKSVLLNKNSCIVIFGEGGLGKTSLSFEIARWAMSKNKENRLLSHSMIPVLIENEVSLRNGGNISPLMNAIRYQLQDITDSTPISYDFAENLIRKKRVLVIIDHLSEMNSNSREAIIKELSELKINACIVTSRIEETLGGITITLIKPLRIAGEGLVVFISEYLNKKNKRQLFDSREFIESCHHFSSIIGESPIIFAKFYAEQLIAHKEASQQIELPTNLPDLMLMYLNDINKNALKLEDGLENRIIHEDAKTLAWESIKESLRPSAFSTDNALKALGNQESAKRRLNYLEHRLILIETIQPSNDHLRFLIDPLAEYLACLFIIKKYRDNVKEWENLMSRIDIEIEQSHEISGFISALKECVSLKGTLNNVPKFVNENLTRY